MNIRVKTLGICSLTLVLVLVLVYLVASPQILHGYTSMEVSGAKKNLNRATYAVQSNVKSLNSQLADWAVWDDAYNFVSNHNQAFIQANFSTATNDPIYDSMLFFNNSNKLVYEYDQQTPPSNMTSKIEHATTLFKYGNYKNIEAGPHVDGLVLTNGGIVMVAAQPILHTSGSGPANGTLIFTKMLSGSTAASLASQTQLDLHIYGENEAGNPSDVRQNFIKPTPDQFIVDLNSQTLAGYSFIKDIEGDPDVLVKITQARTGYQQGLQNIHDFIVILSLSGVLFIGLALILLDRMVLRRIARLSHEVNNITGNEANYHRLNFQGKDEVAQLSRNINAMLKRLKESHHEVDNLVSELRHQKAGVEHVVEMRTKELETEESRFLASINSLPLGFMLVSKDLKPIKINPVSEKLFNLDSESLSKGKIESKTEQNLINKLLHEASKVHLHTRVIVTDLTTEDGRFLHCLLAPVVDGKSVNGVVILGEDVTEVKLLERSKDEFFSIASHELRTPLAAIRGNTSMIQQFYEEKVNDPTFNEMVGDIHEGSVRLIGIVNDFLDVSRLEQGKMQFSSEDIDVSKIVEAVIYEMSSVINEKNLWLRSDKTLSGLPTVYADKDRVKQIIYNLVGNALKFTEKGGITISAEAEKSHLKVLVTDTGRGIPHDKQALLFHKFQQAGQNLHTRDASRGTGLGLYISKLLCEKMGGSLQLEESEIDKGTTFSFTLPLHASKDNKEN